MVAAEAHAETVELEARLTLLDAELERLDARSDLSLMWIEERYYQLLRELRAKEKAVRAEIRELHCADGGAQRRGAEHVRELTRDLESALQSASAEIA